MLAKLFGPRYIVHDVNERLVTKHYFRQYAADVCMTLNSYSKSNTYFVRKVSK